MLVVKILMFLKVSALANSPAFRCTNHTYKMTTAEERTEVHRQLTRVALTHGAKESTLTNGVSVHRMSESVSFDNVRSMLGIAKANENRVHIGTVDGHIVVSLNFNHQPTTTTTTASSSSKSRKRSRDPHEEAAELTVNRVKKGLSEGSGVSDQMLETAQKAVHSLLASVRGANGENVIESYGLSFKTLEKSTSTLPAASRPRLILSARLAPGVAVPLQMLFSALGSKCTQDGMLTVQDSSTLAQGFNLPLSEQAQAAVSHGQKAVSLFATVS